MKKLFLVVATGLTLAACNDTSNNENGTGGSIDSNYSAPVPDASTSPDNTNVHPDSIRSDSTNMSPQGGDGNTSAGKSGSGSSSGKSTNSNNSGSAKDDTNGSK